MCIRDRLYFIRRIKEEGLVHGHDGFEVWVDSPLAIEATNIFRQHIDVYKRQAL